MNLPSKVRIACFDVKVEDWNYISANANHAFGEFSVNEQLIRIDTTINRMLIVDSFIHEINHAIYWAYGIDDKDEEERIVSTMATGWTQVYRDNPEVLEFIKTGLS